MTRSAIFLVLVACGGMDGSVEDGVTLAFTSPAPGAGFTRDQLGASGDLVAHVPVTVDVIGGEPARVGLAVGDVAQPDLVAGAGAADVAGSGTAMLVATAYDAADRPVATASVDVAIADAMPADCKAELALYGVAFADGPASEGVADPVTATIPINGVSYRVLDAANPRTKLFADCRIIRSLARAAPMLRARDIVEVSDLGVYNFRCIGNVGTPPDNCPNGISQHAFAMAIDLAGFTYGDGSFARVETDWVIDPDSEDTCAAPTEPGLDTQLHELICALKAAGMWNIVLTPNYNADHRNHFHVDLTPDADFIE